MPIRVNILEEHVPCSTIDAILSIRTIMTNKIQNHSNHTTIDWFQLNMSNFSTRALILGHHKTGTQISQPIFQLFFKLNSPVHNLTFQLFTVLFLK